MKKTLWLLMSLLCVSTVSVAHSPTNMNDVKIGKNEPRLYAYAEQAAYGRGEVVRLAVDSADYYDLEVYRTGGKNGIELKQKIYHLPPVKQTGKRDAETLNANWKTTNWLTVRNHWQSGAYLVKLTSTTGKKTFVPFVVKDEPSATADFAIMLSPLTYQAYNSWGGKSFYTYGEGQTPGTVLSLNRPYSQSAGAGTFFYYDYNFIRWAEKQKFSFTYVTDIDVHRGALKKLNVRGLIVPGHSEYWTKQMRDEVERFTARGRSLMLLSANSAYWQVRYDDRERTVTGYKYLLDKDPFYKTKPAEATAKFRTDIVNRPEELLWGQMYTGISRKPQDLVVTNASHWIYKGTKLKNGDKIKGVVGGECDKYFGLAKGVTVVAHSPIKVKKSEENPSGEDFADVTVWEKPSGAVVVSVGTFYWNLFLDPFGYEGQARRHPAIERMTVNALDKMLHQ